MLGCASVVARPSFQLIGQLSALANTADKISPYMSYKMAGEQ
jgi:hypothetical protein